METIKVLVGTVTASSGGVTSDTTREVEFMGEEICELHLAGLHKDKITDTRGTVQTLFRTKDGGLVIHINEWSHWQGETNVSKLLEVEVSDLQGNGEFALLGQRIEEFAQPLTLTQALTPRDAWHIENEP